MSRFTLLLPLLGLLLGVNALSAQNWASLDAVTYNANTDKYYFFYGKYCVVKERGKPIDGMPILITDDWSGFPASWHGGNLDAVCFNNNTQKYYFFRGNQVSVKPQGEKMQAPVGIQSEFPGMPWTSVDAAVYNGNTKKYYFFKGDKYVVKVQGEPLDPTLRPITEWGPMLGTQPRPLRDVAFSKDNDAYYFFWDDVYAVKKQGATENVRTPIAYTASNSGFDWAERPANNFVGLANHGGYVAKFKVTWETGGTKKEFKSGDVAVGYTKVVKLPQDAINITISGHFYKFINDADKVFDVSLQTPPNRWYKLTGTTLEPNYETTKKTPFGTQDVADFFTEDVADALEDTGEFLAKQVTTSTKALLNTQAAQDAIRYKPLIEQMVLDAAEAVKDQASIEGLHRVARQKNADIGGAPMKALITSTKFAKTLTKASGFKSFSVGFTAGASSVVGIDGAFGYAINLLPAPDLKQVKGFAGPDLSVGLQGGGGVGVQFALWTDLPKDLSGASMSVNIELATGVSIVYNVTQDAAGAPVFTFGGIVVTPGVTPSASLSIGGGYGWVY